jgi:hypothetical protein
MTLTSSSEHACAEAADLISQSDGLVITAGAGIGIDYRDAVFMNIYPCSSALLFAKSTIATFRVIRTGPRGDSGVSRANRVTKLKSVSLRELEKIELINVICFTYLHINVLSISQ